MQCGAFATPLGAAASFGAGPVSLPPREGSPASLCVFLCCPAQVEALLDMVRLNVNEPDEEGELPVCAAAANGHGNLILKLFRDYRVNILNAR